MSLLDTFDNLKNFNLSDIDLDSIVRWPMKVKAMLCSIVLLVILVIGYFVYIQDLNARLDRVREKEKTLMNELKYKAFQASNLNAYKDQMKQIEEMFENLLKQLPSDTEVPGLLEDITFTGKDAGLKFNEIKLRPEKKLEFYIELPISISVKGTYHELANFVSGVAALSRIVTLHDFYISLSDNKKLRMDILARTYRYNDKGYM